MFKREFIKRVAAKMRKDDIRKPVSSPKQVFHISDDEGNKKDFVVKKSDKNVLFTFDDVAAVVETCMEVIKDALRNGESITVYGFGTLRLNYRKPRATKIPGTDTWVDVDARYVPKFDFGDNLRMCAKMYELSLKGETLPGYEEENTDDFDDADENSIDTGEVENGGD